MISSLRGKVIKTTQKYIILEVNGVGYQVHTTNKVIDSLTDKTSEVKIFTYLNFNAHDNKIDLFGFLDSEELEFFEILTSVSGIGPKHAMTILSGVPPQKLKIAVIKGDAEYLRKVGGIGPKTAERLILELKDKISQEDIKRLKGTDLTSESEAIDALVCLGYSKNQAMEALKNLGR